MKSVASSPQIALHQLSIYNTGRTTAEQVIATFAVRKAQFERIMADLASEKKVSRAQPHLIVGQRGMGKTMMLARIAAEIRLKPELSTRFIPLVFAEEQYAVDRLSKFWLNCLDSLADALELAQDKAAVAAIDATVSRLQSAKIRAVNDDQSFADEVYQAFVQATEATGQRPVLLVDNLQLVFERLGTPQQHSLRELLMRPGSPVLVGASPCVPQETQDYGAPFYDQFKIHFLRPLNVEEMRQLLLHLAEISQRRDIRNRVFQHPGRFDVLRQLTGGNPRTMMLLFLIYAEDFAPSVFGDLEGLLDRVTPLYKARFEELTSQQQVIASAVANHWDPVTAATLAKATSLPHSTISSQLDRLEKDGVIERTELFGETSTGYQMAERFFNIWFLLRSASRRQRREVESLTRFLEAFYEAPDRSHLANRFQEECNFSADRHMWMRALARTLEPREAHDLQRHAELDALRQTEEIARRQLEEVIDFKALHPTVLAFAKLRKKLEALVPPNREIKPEDFATKILSDRKMFKSGDRQKLASHARLSMEEVEKALASTKASGAADVVQYGQAAVDWLAHRLSSGQLSNVYDVDDWNAAFRQAHEASHGRILLDTISIRVGGKLASDVVSRICRELQPEIDSATEEIAAWAIFVLHYKLGESKKAEDLLRQALARDETQPELWRWLGSILTELDQYDEAIRAFEKSIALDEKPGLVLTFLGDVLGHCLGRYDEAESAYRKAIAIERSPSYIWDAYGNFLSKLPDRLGEAEIAYRRAIALREDDASAWGHLGKLLCKQTLRLTEAEVALKTAVALADSDAFYWIRLGDFYRDFLERPLDEVAAYEKAFELDPTEWKVANTLLFLYRDVLGEGAAAESKFHRLLACGLTSEHKEQNDLHRALFAAYARNWGLASDSLKQAMVHGEGLILEDFHAWINASAVLLHLDYSTELLELLDQGGETSSLRPWVEALRAHMVEDRRVLQNIAPEIRETAESIYDSIEKLLKRLPESTRRRPFPAIKRSRSRRQN